MGLDVGHPSDDVKEPYGHKLWGAGKRARVEIDMESSPHVGGI